ncbi:calmodulin-related [Lithospermum erythrorhizon]|uniref:Calmodulin-related n=1 Tax=Lithospermum erythrorhizon TaxID=34254 RepID=A0AAV3S2W2_LITER
MLKVVVFVVAATLILLTIILTQSVPKQMFKDLHHDTIITSFEGKIRRLGVTHPSFDPLVSKMERIRQEERREARLRRAADIAEKNELLYEDVRINTRLRLMFLFSTIDTSPHDEKIDYLELEAWILKGAIDNINDRTQKELEDRDKDGDGVISFFECLPHFSPEYIEKNINNTEYGEVGWWLEQFTNADVDHSKTLNLYEFRDFLHPEDCRNERIQTWILNQKIRQWDIDNDQQLNQSEFERGAYESYKIYYQYETGEIAQSPNSIFSKLDINKDRLLRAEELKPIVQYLNPGELVYAKHYTRYLINEADEDGDGKLKLSEMMNHASVFYNSVNDTGRRMKGEDSYHDEL